MASAEVIALLNSDSDGDDSSPFGQMEASIAAGWQAPNAAGASAFEAINLGIEKSDDGRSPGAREGKAVCNGSPAKEAASEHNLPSEHDARTRAAGDAGANNVLVDARSVLDLDVDKANLANEAHGIQEAGDDARAGGPDGYIRALDDAMSVNGVHGHLAPSAGTREDNDWEVAGGVPEGKGDNAKGQNVVRLSVAEQLRAEQAEGEREGDPNVEGSAGEGDDAARRSENRAPELASCEGDESCAPSPPVEGRHQVSKEDSVSGKEIGGVGHDFLPSAPDVRSNQPDSLPAGSPSSDDALSAVTTSGRADVDVPSIDTGARVEGGVEEDCEAAQSSSAVAMISVTSVTSSVEESCVVESCAVESRPADNVKTFMDTLPPGFVRCPGCPMVYDLVPNEAAARGGGGGVALKDLPKGANLSRRAAMRHNGRHRFRCPACSTCFCGSCRCTPYHMGFDCEGWTVHQAKPKCTFCGDAADEPDEGTDANCPREDGLAAPPCCSAEECRERAHEGCRKRLRCGHPCRGPGAGECLPCIESGCPSAELDGDAEFCNVCWTESLLAAPCVKLECGHFVHVSCGREQLRRGRTTARLTFGFMSCPVCRADKALAMHSHLSKEEGIAEQLKLALEVEELALQRLRADELPPLQKSSMESLQAKMRRRMAGLARYRQFDGNGANWKGGGPGGPFPVQLPYHRAQPVYNMPRRVRAAGRLRPMFPEAYPRPGDWQPFNGPGGDWGMHPFVPLPPPPPLANNAPVGGRPAGGGAAGAGHAAGAGARESGGAPPASQEDFLKRKRAMLIAQADVAMARAVAAGAAMNAGPAGGAAAPVIRQNGGGMMHHPLNHPLNHSLNHPLNHPVNHPMSLARPLMARDRIDKRLEKGRALLQERRRARRESKKELEDLVLEDDGPSANAFAFKPRRSGRPPIVLSPGPPGMAARSGADLGAMGASLEEGGEVKETTRQHQQQNQRRQPEPEPEPEALKGGEQLAFQSSPPGPMRLDTVKPAVWPVAPNAPNTHIDYTKSIHSVDDAAMNGGAMGGDARDIMHGDKVIDAGRRRREVMREPAENVREGVMDIGDGEGKNVVGAWDWGVAGAWRGGGRVGDGAEGAPPIVERAHRLGNEFPDSGGLKGARGGDVRAGPEGDMHVIRSGSGMEIGSSGVQSESPADEGAYLVVAGAFPPPPEAPSRENHGAVSSDRPHSGDAKYDVEPWMDAMAWPLPVMAGERVASPRENDARPLVDKGSVERAPEDGEETDDEVTVLEQEILDAAALFPVVPLRAKRVRRASQGTEFEPFVAPPSGSAGDRVVGAAGVRASMAAAEAFAFSGSRADDDRRASHEKYCAGDGERDSGLSLDDAEKVGNSIFAADEDDEDDEDHDLLPEAIPGDDDRSLSSKRKRVRFGGRCREVSRPIINDGGGKVNDVLQRPWRSPAPQPCAPAVHHGREAKEQRAAGAAVDAMMAAAKLAAEDLPDEDIEALLRRGRDRRGNRADDGKIDLAAKGMLKLQAAPVARKRRPSLIVVDGSGHEVRVNVNVRAGNGAGNGLDAMSAVSAEVPPKSSSPASVGANAGQEVVQDVEAGAGSASPRQSKEERAEMVGRALKKYSFYQCHSCRKPYFGGLVSCEPAAPPSGGDGRGEGGGRGGGGGARSAGEDAEGAGEAAAAERGLADVKPQELLCGKCSAGSGGAKCSEHGEEFMEHKCYWCCRKVASYFCGGVMHFCDVCHLRGFATKPKPCLGGARCLFGGAHPPKARNGHDEFVLGCGICRPKPEEGESTAVES